MALDRNGAKQMDDLWRKLGNGIKNKDYVGTFGEIGYEGGYLLRLSAEGEFILIPYFDEDMIADYSYGPSAKQRMANSFCFRKKSSEAPDSLWGTRLRFGWH